MHADGARAYANPLNDESLSDQVVHGKRKSEFTKNIDHVHPSNATKVIKAVGGT